MGEKKKIGIVGFGYVGKSTARLFKDRYDTWAYDPAYLKDGKFGQCFDNDFLENGFGFISGQLASKLYQLADCDAIVICVPTPIGEDGACDTSIVESVLTELGKHKPDPLMPLIILRSTVPPGTTERLAKKAGLNVVFWPEFAGEGKYWTQYAFRDDAKAVPFVILGGDKPFTKRVVDLLVPILGPEKKYVQTSLQTAEMAKYMINTWLAVKVGFCNDVFDICEKLDVDYREARELWLLDPRINESHTAVFPDSRGFSGKCIPKDSLALLRHAEKAGCRERELRMLRAAIEANQERRPEAYK